MSWLSKTFSQSVLRRWYENIVWVAAKAIKIGKSSMLRSMASQAMKKIQQRWINALPNVLGKITKNTVVCVNHWSLNYKTYQKKGHIHPVHPPPVLSMPKSFYVKFPLLCEMLKTVMLTLLHDDRLMNRELQQPILILLQVGDIWNFL